MSKRVCPTTGCPNLIQPGQRRCTDCAGQHERQRGTRQQRGYDAAHQRTRAQWKRILDAQPWPCSRCGRSIYPGEAWHLDHTDDRTAYLGPSCVKCNTAAGGKAAH